METEPFKAQHHAAFLSRELIQQFRAEKWFVQYILYRTNWSVMLMKQKKLKHFNQGVTKRCRLSWLTKNEAPSCMSPNAGGGGVAFALSQPMSTTVHRSPNKLWRSNSKFIPQSPTGSFTSAKLCWFLTQPAVDWSWWVFGRVADPDWIRIQSGQWIRIRIQEGKNDQQK